VQVHAADIQDRAGAEQVLAETHELYRAVTHGWADQAYAGELLELAATLLGITLAIVKRSPNQRGLWSSYADGLWYEVSRG
jgi:hypothetical protein